MGLFVFIRVHSWFRLGLYHPTAGRRRLGEGSVVVSEQTILTIFRRDQ